MLRKFGNYLLSTDARASGAALLFSTLGYFGIPTGFLNLVILAMVALIKGPRSGLVVLAWAILPSLCMLYLHEWAFFDMASALRCALILGLALLFRATSSWRTVLEFETLLGLLSVLGFHLVVGDSSQWWSKILGSYFEKLGLAQQLNLNAEQLQQFVQQITPYATGLVVVGVLLGVFILLLLARWWQKSLVFSAFSFGPEFAAIRMSPWTGAVILFAVLGWLFLAQANWVNCLADCLPVLLFPFVVAGLSILQYGADRKKPKKLWGGEILGTVLKVLIVIAYIGLIFVPWIVALVLALIGLVDSVFSIRQNLFDRKRVRA